MPKTEFHIVIIGSGNMAHALGKLFSTRHKIVQVISRNAGTGKKLAKTVKAVFSADIKDIYTNADFYFLCVPDDQISTTSKKLKKVNGVLVHHSGAKPITAIKDHTTRAVLYPFVSVNPATKLNTTDTPVFYHSDSSSTDFLLHRLFEGYVFKPAALSDPQRLKLHLAGVLVNNFTNHLYEKASHLTAQVPGTHQALVALAQQALDNFIQQQTKTRQTGPARRNDKTTLKKHLDLIKKDRELAGIYVSLSRSIYKTYHHE